MNDAALPTRPVRRGFGVVLCGCLLAASMALPAYAAETGSLAPSFVLPGQAHQVKLDDLRGKLVYLDFWASWCGPCRRSFPWMNDMQSRYGAQGLQIVGVNVDASHADAVDFLSTLPARFAVGFDAEGAVAARYGIKGMPSTVLVGPDGKVVATHVGFNDDDKPQLEALIKQHLPSAEGR
ncbi:TlpA family protein disulfide reductase [Oxalobacteraceae bacterium OM1]|nr:TlpA family protein disulfide reductase [Oxalobacteraceae bacterium OM1]